MLTVLGLAATVSLPVATPGPAGATASPAARDTPAPGDPVDVGSAVPATANDLHAPQAHNSPQVAVDPTDARLAALAYRVDNPEFSCGLALSGDGGASWTDADPLAALPDGVDHCYAPQIAFDADGTLYFLFVGLAGQGNTPQGVWLMTSDDAGRTFSRPWQVLGPKSYQVRLAVDRAAGEAGRLHLAWLDVTGEPSIGGLPPTANPIVTAHSDDGGQTFSEPVTVSGPDRRRVVAPQIAIGATGEVHVAYYDLGGDTRDYRGLAGPVWPEPWTVEVATSRDGGATFAQPVVVDDRLKPAGRVPLIFTMPGPALAADGDGRVYAGWHDARRGTADAFVARSRDGGRSWDAPVVVGGSAVDDTAQLLPEVAVAPNGRVETVFFDHDGGAASHRRHVNYAASTDQAASFAPTRRLTKEPSDARTGPRVHLPAAQGHVEIGTGLALHAGATQALAAWPDTRFAVPGTAQQDLYAATAARQATDRPIWLWLAGGLAGLAVLTALGLGARRWRRHRRAAAAVCLAGLTLAACDPGGGTQQESLPDTPARVEIGMDEYAFNAPGQVPAGRVTVHVVNHGDEPHELALVPLPDDAELGELLQSPTPVAVPPTYTVSPRQPGETATFTVTLDAGRYGLVCFVEDADGIQHHRHGMFAQLTARP